MRKHSTGRIDRRTVLKTSLAALGAAWAGKSEAQILPPGQIAPTLTLRSRTLFHTGWKFLLYDVEGGERPFFDDSAWRDVVLPHDWSIEGPFNQDAPSTANGGYLPTGVAWYRNTFAPPALTSRQRLLIEFEGIYRYSTVYLNGQALGLRPNGFVGFQYDLTPFLVPGQANFLAVRVANGHQPNLRWYSGSGIYRYVWLTVADRLRVDFGGTYITTPKVSAAEATIRVTTTVANTDTSPAAMRVGTQIFDRLGKLVSDLAVGETIAAGKTASLTQEFVVKSPDLWSIETPTMYNVFSTVRQDGVRVDEYLSNFGIREIRFDKDAGVILNGQRVKLKGVSMHHDLGCLGAAVHERTIERRLLAMQSLGCNAIRTSHNPPCSQLLDLCDRMGFLVMDEAFDKWFGDLTEVDPGEPKLYQWWQQDLLAMLVRDRNHPSIMLWSVGNEAGVPGSEEHDSTLKQLVDFVHKTEPTRPVTCALVPVETTPEDAVAGVVRSAGIVDVLSVNYQEAFFDRFRAALPNISMLSTESLPFYARTIDGVVDTTILTPPNPWWEVVNRDFVAGEFVWNGIDHIGESTGWPSKGWANGLFDSCAFPKPAVSFFKTIWRSDPNVRIYVLSDTLRIDPGFAPWRWPKSAEHWNFKGQENQVLQLNTISNCETVELIVNGKSNDVRRPLDFPNWTIPWFVPYAAGTVEAIGRNGGEKVSQHLLQTAGAPAKIDMRADRDRITADGIEVTHIEVTLLDANGILVPDQDQLLSFLVTGPAKVIGVDNGDQRSSESYQGTSRTTFQGKALVIIQSTGSPGPITVFGFAVGLPAGVAGVFAAS